VGHSRYGHSNGGIFAVLVMGEFVRCQRDKKLLKKWSCLEIRKLQEMSRN